MSLKASLSSFNNKFIFLKRSFGNKPFRLLDIGAGNHSATKTKMVFPQCEYYGVDIEKQCLKMASPSWTQLVLTLIGKPIITFHLTLQHYSHSG